MRWRFLDRIESLEKGRRARGAYGVSFEVATLERPGAEGTSPRILALEAIGELAAWLVIASTDFQRRPVLGSFDRCRLGRDVGPGERVTVECELVRLYETAGLVNGRATIGDELIAQVERASCGLLPLSELEDPDEVRAEYDVLTRKAASA